MIYIEIIRLLLSTKGVFFARKNIDEQLIILKLPVKTTVETFSSWTKKSLMKKMG